MGLISELLRKQKPPYSDWPRSYDSFRSDMATAAGIGVARIRCHGNTWAYLQENVPQDPWRGSGTAFAPPSDDEIEAGDDGMVTVPISGTTAAAILSFCRSIQSTSSWGELDCAIGRRVGSAISRALENVIPSASAEGPTAVIYLDDQLAAAAAGDRAGT
jgi:hypothetical protein